MMAPESIPAMQKCPSCGEAIPKYGEFAASLEDQDITEFIQSVNQHLTETGTGAAESAFGLGCYIGFIPVALLVIILFLFGVRNLIVMALVALVSVLLTTGVATLLSRRARATNIETTYRRVVEPQIDIYIDKRSINRVEFDVVARQVLTTDAPLLDYISSQREPGFELDKE